MSPPRPRRSSHPVHLILGEDAYLREVLREQIISARVPAEARAMAVARFSLEETPLAEGLAQAAPPAAGARPGARRRLARRQRRRPGRGGDRPPARPDPSPRGGGGAGFCAR